MLLVKKLSPTHTHSHTNISCCEVVQYWHTPSCWSCFLGIRFTDGGMDMDGMRNPAGSVSIDPAIIPSPAPPSRALNLFRHDGERRKDLSSPLYGGARRRERSDNRSLFLQRCVRSKPLLELSPPPVDGRSPRLTGC